MDPVKQSNSKRPLIKRSTRDYEPTEPVVTSDSAVSWAKLWTRKNLPHLKTDEDFFDEMVDRATK